MCFISKNELITSYVPEPVPDTEGLLMVEVEIVHGLKELSSATEIRHELILSQYRSIESFPLQTQQLLATFGH